MVHGFLHAMRLRTLHLMSMPGWHPPMPFRLPKLIFRARFLHTRQGPGGFRSLPIVAPGSYRCYPFPFICGVCYRSILHGPLLRPPHCRDRAGTASYIHGPLAQRTLILGGPVCSLLNGFRFASPFSLGGTTSFLSLLHASRCVRTFGTRGNFSRVRWVGPD